MPGILATGFGQTGILATSPNPYQTTQPGYYRLTHVALAPGIPVFSTETIYKLSDGPGTPDISVRFTQMLAPPGGPISIDLYAI